jgi:hypothetical protein
MADKTSIMKFLITLFAVLLLVTPSFAADPGATNSANTAAGANFQELYDLLRKNLTGVSDAELEQAAVQGLIKQLHPLVSIATNAPPTTNGAPLAATSVLEGTFAYFRFNEIAEGADKEFSSALKRIGSTNKLRGLVLDLRFAGGADYAAAASLADPFLPPRQPVIDWGEGVKLSTTKTNPVHLPVAILINKETRGAAEAFAAVLRRSDIGLILGGNSAGQAFITRDFTLKNGQKLSIATTPVKIAGGQTIDRRGLAPDIKVEVPLAEERAFVQDAYRPVPRLAAGPSVLPNVRDAGSTNLTAAPGTNGGPRASRRRLNEAELVRMQREGIDFESDFPTGREAGPLRPPVITDPVLARAIDLLKGLSVVHQFRSAEPR